MDGQVCVVATDPAVARGAIGVAECRGMSELLARARDEGAPIVLLLDSSGARVDEGLPALGAFRVLLRETLLTRLATLADARGRGARLLRRRESARLHVQPSPLSDRARGWRHRVPQ